MTEGRTNFYETLEMKLYEGYLGNQCNVNLRRITRMQPAPRDSGAIGLVLHARTAMSLAAPVLTAEHDSRSSRRCVTDSLHGPMLTH